MIEVGTKQGDLIVIKNGLRRNGKQAVILCRCKCGKEFLMDEYRFKTQKPQMCRSCSNKLRATHKETTKNSRLYRIWNGMKNRAGKIKNYKNIKVCDEWSNYLSFKEWAIKSGYKDNFEIDRIDATDDYEPNNCRWVNKSEQNINIRRKNSTGYYGVSEIKNKKLKNRFKSRIKGKHLGYFKTAEEAAIVRDKYIINNKIVAPLNFKKDMLCV